MWRNLKRKIIELTVAGIKPSQSISDESLIVAFNKKLDKSYLISFPRTGSHWLRMLLELYFEKPTLVRTFYKFNTQDYLLLHTHDLDLNVQRQNVIYLYREPISTIYSQLQYHREDFNNLERIAHWTNLYGQHLNKWLNEETFTIKKTIITYEGMQHNLAGEIAKVAKHFEVSFDADRFTRIAAQVTKEEVKRKTPHDEQVVQLDTFYQESRASFQEKYGQLVWEVLLRNRAALKNAFAESTR